MKTTIFWHIVGSEDDEPKKIVVDNEFDFEKCLVYLNNVYKCSIDDVVGKAKYIEKYRNKIMDW
ncbi:MAG: hypothetical protein KA953_00625 [Lachnospiraceae bacterium]|nr:hypothetical protein [Lachnospiraceae bacterium]